MNEQKKHNNAKQLKVLTRHNLVASNEDVFRPNFGCEMTLTLKYNNE